MLEILGEIECGRVSVSRSFRQILKALATPAGNEIVEIPGEAERVGAKNGRNVFGRGGSRRNP